MVSGAAGALPGAIWLGGVMAVVFFPFLAAASIWLYVLVFVFSGLWFQHYTLEALARLACMSQSTLRTKFRAAYQCSVFEWLHERRMVLARERLAQGLSVQEAARLVGYRHATNFATAFRKRFGVAPSGRERH